MVGHYWRGLVAVETRVYATKLSHTINANVDTYPTWLPISLRIKRKFTLSVTVEQPVYIQGRGEAPSHHMNRSRRKH